MLLKTVQSNEHISDHFEHVERAVCNTKERFEAHHYDCVFEYILCIDFQNIMRSCRFASDSSKLTGIHLVVSMIVLDSVVG